jgi:hypothetical protein
MVGLASSQVFGWLEDLLLIELVQWFELGQASCGLLLTGPLLVLGHINLIFVSTEKEVIMLKSRKKKRN